MVVRVKNKTCMLYENGVSSYHDNHKNIWVMNNKNNKKNKGLVLIPEKGTILPTQEAFDDVPKDILKGLDVLIDKTNRKHEKLDVEELALCDRRTSIYLEESNVRKAVGSQLYNMRKDFLFTQGSEKIRLR